MKKIVLFLTVCFLLAPTLYSSTWIALDTAVTDGSDETGEAANSSAPKITQPSVKNPHVLLPILQGKTLFVSLQIEREADGDRAVFASFIKDGYNAWFEYVAQQIKEQGRAEEFADVLRLIDRPIPISVVKEGPADMQVRVWKDAASLSAHCKNQPVAGCHHENIMEFSKKVKRAENRWVFIHEIGHSLGLGDQYPSAAQQANPLYASHQVQPGVMNDSSKGFGCGDVDGLINLIDYNLKLERPNNAWWKSFCPGSEEKYKDGQSSLANRYLLGARNHQWILQEYENGQKIRQTSFPYARQSVDPFYVPQREEVLQYDGAGRPVHWKGSLGEDIYRAYGQEKETVEELVAQNGEMLSFQQTKRINRDGVNHLFTVTYFSLGDRRVGTLIGEQGETLRAAIYHESMYNEQKPYYKVQVEFDLTDRKINKIYSTGNEKESVLRKQLGGSSSDSGLDDVKIRESAWVSRFIEWANHWPEYVYDLETTEAIK